MVMYRETAPVPRQNSALCVLCQDECLEVLSVRCVWLYFNFVCLCSLQFPLIWDLCVAVCSVPPCSSVLSAFRAPACYVIVSPCIPYIVVLLCMPPCAPLFRLVERGSP